MTGFITHTIWIVKSHNVIFQSYDPTNLISDIILQSNNPTNPNSDIILNSDTILNLDK
jgi:hypothetical protein